MKNLRSIINKFSELKPCERVDGLTAHEWASLDKSKLILGRSVEMFKIATGISDYKKVKRVLMLSTPDMEAHIPNRKYPKKYVGKQKATLFMNAQQIVRTAKSWDHYLARVEELDRKQVEFLTFKKNRDEMRLAYLKENAIRVFRQRKKPEHFYETAREMLGADGWFDSTGKRYKLTEHYTGWKFETAQAKKDFINLK